MIQNIAFVYIYLIYFITSNFLFLLPLKSTVQIFYVSRQFKFWLQRTNFWLERTYQTLTHFTSNVQPNQEQPPLPHTIPIRSKKNLIPKEKNGVYSPSIIRFPASPSTKKIGDFIPPSISRISEHPSIEHPTILSNRGYWAFSGIDQIFSFNLLSVFQDFYFSVIFLFIF